MMKTAGYLLARTPVTVPAAGWVGGVVGSMIGDAVAPPEPDLSFGPGPGVEDVFYGAVIGSAVGVCSATLWCGWLLVKRRTRTRPLSTLPKGRIVSSLVAVIALQAAPAHALSSVQLLARYEPVSVLHPAERFAPVGVDGFLHAAQLEQRTAGAWTTVTPTPSSLPTADPAGCTSTSDSPCWRLRDAR